MLDPFTSPVAHLYHVRQSHELVHRRKSKLLSAGQILLSSLILVNYIEYSNLLSTIIKNNNKKVNVKLAIIIEIVVCFLIQDSKN